MRSRTVAFMMLLAAAFAGPVRAQDQLARDPGYVDLATIESWFDEEATLEVNIKGALLKLVAEASRYEDPELSQLLTRLKAIQVRGYDVSSSQFEAVDRRARELGQRLERSGWDTVARVRDDDERVHMFVRVQDESIAGLVVMVVSPGEDETVFVNIVGDIDPEEIGRIGRKFDIGPLHDGMVHRDR